MTKGHFATCRVSMAAAATLAIGASTARYDWSTRDPGPASSPKEQADIASTRAACAGVIKAEPVVEDHPTPAQAAGLKNCDAEALLYGIGRPADPIAARRCAIVQRERNPDTNTAYFEGPGILAVAYANGLGGSRNLAVAIHMACGIADAPFATEGRITDLQAQRGSASSKPFAICEAATSGVSQGVCADHDARLADAARGVRIAKLEQGWPARRRTAFDEAYRRLQTYSNVAHELDCFGGTAHAACTIDGIEKDKGRYLNKVDALLGRNPPPKIPAIADRRNAATTPAAWQALVADVDPDHRAWYEINGQKTIAARERFEQALLAFAATVPGTTPHAARVLFADL